MTHCLVTFIGIAVFQDILHEEALLYRYNYAGKFYFHITQITKNVVSRNWYDDLTSHDHVDHWFYFHKDRRTNLVAFQSYETF